MFRQPVHSILNHTSRRRWWIESCSSVTASRTTLESIHGTSQIKLFPSESNAPPNILQVSRFLQGYHDIITVLFLTLPPELQFPCAEAMSLQRVRDSMGPGLEPLIGLLRFVCFALDYNYSYFARLTILKNLLQLTDAPFAQILEEYAHFYSWSLRLIFIH